MKTYTCDKCAKVFKQKSGYTDHMNKKIDCSGSTVINEVIEKKVEEKVKPAKAEKAKEVEKATLGDLEALSALKEQLEEGEKKKKSAAPKKVSKETDTE